MNFDDRNTFVNMKFLYSALPDPDFYVYVLIDDLHADLEESSEILWFLCVVPVGVNSILNLQRRVPHLCNALYFQEMKTWNTLPWFKTNFNYIISAWTAFLEFIQYT